MKRVSFDNPFGAPVYHEETVSSTMDVSRLLARSGEPHGTVIFADFQESGRGRGSRPWITEKGRNLMFTVLLRYPDFSAVPSAITLKTGLAVSLALEDIFPLLSGRVEVKWPNDVMIGAEKARKKAAGILAEADGSLIFIGVGVNLAQKEFPEEIRERAVSIAAVLEDLEDGEKTPGGLLPIEARKALLERILIRLYGELENRGASGWKTRLEERLYKKGEQVSFADGAAGSGSLIQGRLEGIGPGGELLLLPRGESAPRLFVTGELKVYN